MRTLNLILILIMGVILGTAPTVKAQNNNQDQNSENNNNEQNENNNEQNQNNDEQNQNNDEQNQNNDEQNQNNDEQNNDERKNIEQKVQVSLEENPSDENNEPEPIKETYEVKAQRNLKQFREHFASLMAGHREGQFVVVREKSPVWDYPKEGANSVEFLTVGDEVHGIRLIQNKWIQIGRNKFMDKADLKNYGFKTKGTEIYKQYID